MAFEKSLSLDASFVDALAQVAAIFTAHGQKDKALARVRQQVQVSLNNPSLYNLLGEIALAQAKDTEAEEAFKKAIQLRDDLLISYLNLIRLYAKKPSYDQAIAYYESIIVIKPNIFQPYMALGMLYSLQEKYEKANEYYKKVIKLNSENTQAINELAWNYTEHGGNLDEALSLAQKSREQAVDRAPITDTLGWIYYKKKVYAQAVSLLKESAAAMANNPVARYHWGWPTTKMGIKTCQSRITAGIAAEAGFPRGQGSQRSSSHTGVKESRPPRLLHFSSTGIVPGGSVSGLRHALAISRRPVSSGARLSSFIYLQKKSRFEDNLRKQT